LLKVVDGEVFKGDKITAASNGEHYDILEVSITPHLTPLTLYCQQEGIRSYM